VRRWRGVSSKFDLSLPNKSKPMISVTLSDNSSLVLKQGEMAETLDQLRTTFKGRTKAFVIHEIAFEVLMSKKGPTKAWEQELMAELRSWIDDHGYDFTMMKAKATKPAKR
jgi:hypothetical protein